MASTDLVSVYDCKTKISLQQLSFKWTIVNLDQREKYGIFNISSSFSSHGINLVIEFKKLCESHSFNVGLYMSGSGVYSHTYAANINIKGEDGSSISGTIGDIQSEDYITVFGCHRQYFEQTRDQRQGGRTYNFDKKNTFLEVKLDIEIFSRNHDVSFGKKVYPEVLLKKVLGDPKFSDVTLVSETKEFKCHKVILAAMSPVFDRMFEADMKEADTGVVDIPDISPKIIDMLLTFIYTGELKETVEDMGDLLYASTKYQVSEMIAKCEEWMKKNLRMETAVVFLCWADKYLLRDLKSNAVQVIARNRTSWNKNQDFASKMENCSKELLFELFNA